MRLLFLSDASCVHTERWCRFFHRRGHRILVVSVEKARPMGLPCVELPSRIPFPPLKYLSKLPAIRRIVSSFEPELLNSHFVPNYGLLGSLAGFRPLVVSTWGSDVLISPRRSSLHRWRARYVLRRADLITSDGENLTEAIVELGGDPRRILTVPMGVDLGIYSPPDEKPQPPLIVSTRRLEPVYDVLTFVKAAAELAPDHPHLRFAAAGDGVERRKLERYVRERGLREFGFLGNLEEKEVAGLLRKAWVYVSTSLSDSTSVSLLEAMACGAVPVVSDIPGNRSWIRDGRNGFLFAAGNPRDLAAKIVRVLEDPELRESIVRENVSLVRRSASWEKTMERVEESFAELIASSGNAS